MSKITELIALMNDSTDKEEYTQQLVDDFYNANGNYYRYFRELINEIGVITFIENYDFKKIEEYFKKNNDEYDKYKLFVCLLEREETKNKVIEYLLNDEYLFDQVFSEMDEMYSLFSDIDYDKIVRIIEKIEKSNFKYSNNFICSVENSKQKKLLSENISDEVLYWMIPKANIEVKKEFFSNDKRAYNVILNNKISILNLLESGTKLQDDILYSDLLFNKMKSTSIVEFRRRLNLLLQSNPNVFILEKANKYLSSLIDTYNPNTNLFEAYQDLTLENINEKARKSNNIYILSVVNLHDIYNVKDDGELKEYLKKQTSKKLKELIIDYLFSDNYYNVYLNVKELLDYNHSLEKPLIEEEYIDFYNKILNFDVLTNEQKLEIYHQFKNSNINTLFYEHLRISKNHAYESLINKLFHPNKANLKESLKQVPVYELNGEPFTMIIRGMNREFRKNMSNKRNCYSIIDDTNISVMSGLTYYYGYYNINSNMIFHMFENDAYSNEYDTNMVNRIKKSEDLTKYAGYSEVQIANEMENGEYKSPTPDFMVEFDYISDAAIKEAERLNIPIVKIVSEKYLNPSLEESHMLHTNVSDGFRYVNTIEEEENIKRIKR